MKKLSFFLMAMLFSVMSFAQEAIYTLDGTITGGTSAYAEASSITQDNIAWSVTGNTTMNPWRIGGKSITNQDRAVYSKNPIAYNIDKIELTHGTASSITVNSLKLIISDAANGAGETIDVTFKASATTTIDLPEGDYTNKYFKFLYNVTVSGTSNKYVQFKSAKFYAALAEDAVKAPVIKGAEDFISETEIAIEAEDDVTVYYTVDGTEPTTASTVYTAPFTVKETTTVKAVAYRGEKASFVTSATFTKATQLTCAEAAVEAMKVASNNATTNITYVVYGYVTELDGGLSSGQQKFWVSDTKGGENTFYSYFCNVPRALVVGDYIQMFGKLTKYNTTPQMKNGDITILPAPVAKFNVTATAENGTVTGAGEYEENAEATLTATAAEGYEFTCWTSGEDTVSTANPYTFAVTANVALVANFNKKAEPEHTYTVAGSSATVFGTAWDAENTANNMTKQEDGTYKLEKTELTLAAGTIEFKVVEDHNWNVAYPSENYKLTIAENGIYTITITFNPADKAVAATATKTGDVGKIIPTIAMHGNFLGSWADTENLTLAADEATATLTLTIAEGNYEFGVRIDGTWTSNGVNFTRENASAKIVSGSGNLKLAADVAGEYTFTWTFETNTLTVTYPALVTAIEVNVTDATVTSGEWSIDLAGSWNDQALTIKLWQDNTQGFGSYAPNTETGYYILLGAKELTPTTEGVYADNGDGTFTFTCSATEGTTQYNITITGNNPTQGGGDEEYPIIDDAITNLTFNLDEEPYSCMGGPSEEYGIELYLVLGEEDGMGTFTLTEASEIYVQGSPATFISGYLTDIDTSAPAANAVIVAKLPDGSTFEFHIAMSSTPVDATVIVVENATLAIDSTFLFNNPVSGDVYEYSLTMSGNWTDSTNTTYLVTVEFPVYDPATTEEQERLANIKVGDFAADDAPFLGMVEDFLTITNVNGVITAKGLVSGNGLAFDITISGSLAQDPSTGVESLNGTVAPVKVIENGQIFIIRNGVKYNAQGAQL